MLAPRVTSQLPKYRWNSTETAANEQKQKQEQEQERDATNTAEQEVPASDPQDAQVLESAVDSSTSDSTLSGHASSDAENARVPDAAVESSASDSTPSDGASSDAVNARVLDSAIDSAISNSNPSGDGPPADPSVSRKGPRPSRIQRFSESEPKRNLFIANLFYEASSDTLRERMEEFGTVESCKVILDERGMSKG